MLDCDDISFKCAVRPAVSQLLSGRAKHAGALGQLGGVTFTDLDTFLKKKRPAFDGIILRTAPEQGVLGVGDVHGDLLALLAALHLGGAVDTAGAWSGGNMIVVQCGDFLDRNRPGIDASTSTNAREELDIVQYIAGLDEQARAQGGRVLSVLGNHEVARVWGWENYTVYDVDGGWGADKPQLFRDQMAKYMAHHCPLICQVNNMLFMHGGLLQWDNLPTSVADINRAARAALMDTDAPLPDLMEQIVMTRELSTSERKSSFDKWCTTQLTQLFAHLGLDLTTGGLVLGHSVQEGGIPHICKGHVWLVDLGLSEAFGRKDAEHPLGVLRLTLNDTDGSTVAEVVQNYRTACSNGVCKSSHIRRFYRNGEEFACRKSSAAVKSVLR